MTDTTLLRTALGALLGLSLIGCTSGPDFQAPALPPQAAAAFSTQLPGTDAAHEPPAEWWKLYRDAALDHLIEKALAANTDLREAEANLMRAQAIFGASRSARLPATELSAGASYGRDQASWPGPEQAPKQWSYSGGLGIAYEVDLFGRVRRDIEAARYNTEAVAASRDAVRLAVVAETTRAYVDSCALGQATEVATRSVELTRHSLDLIRQRQGSGAATQLDVERAATSHAQAQASLAPIVAQRQNRLLELAALTGGTPADIPAVAASCNQLPTLAAELPVGDGAQLLRRRPDVRASERQLAADTARIGVAVANLYPNITLGASANYLRNDSLQGDRSWSFGLGPLITWNFPNQLAARAQVRQAEAQSAAALARFDGTVLTALKEVEQALASYAATLQERDALQRARDYAGNAFTLAQARYQAGAIGYLDVLLSQTVLVNTEAALIDAGQRLGSQRVSLFLALGGGWDSTEDPAPEARGTLALSF
ncbi:efflux transporter outer membrane subunit [Pseudomaricurvus sp. HS19]|uniref:efflux transporter outer membrane subunit n=1 Tax=Pseudomaricurvus sp. HS19 TaxID=2692626 RepID=UPI0013722E0A|nr:TolC family protein [Pseudomaricurvus sp. HS19]MYM61902.1 efflux transporter outer membrane subunit [Pseudomaricurvus sp. HS19]